MTSPDPAGRSKFMKWIKLKEGNFKLVEDDDPRPEDKEFAGRKVEGVPTILNKPPWLIRADTYKLATDGELNHKYTEAVIGESKKWTSSGKWASYEKSRKDYIKSQKAEWIKKGARPEDRDEIMR